MEAYREAPRFGRSSAGGRRRHRHRRGVIQDATQTARTVADRVPAAADARDLMHPSRMVNHGVADPQIDGVDLAPPVHMVASRTTDGRGGYRLVRA
jgi:hypothetical protein